MTTNGITRVHYFEEQFLRLAELEDEQAYHIHMRRQHNLGGHTWGIVAGLEIEQDRDGNLAVLPGMAVDGYGRELILPYPVSLSPRVFAEKGGNELEVWLLYARQPAGALPAGYTLCRPSGSVQAHRFQEVGRIELRVSDRDLFVDATAAPPRREPPDVPPADLQSPSPGDDPERAWPVFLGLVRRVEGEPVMYTVDLGGRPYAGLVGEAIYAPSGRAWVQIGAEEVDDPRRFAVFLPGPDPTRDYPPRLALDKDGNLEIGGNTTLYGDLTVEGGSVEFQVGAVAASPWSIYHTRAASEETATAATIAPEQLRITMAAAPLVAEVVVGIYSTQANQFVPCLTIGNDCKVTVSGNLTVKGRLDPQGGMAEGGVTEEAQAMITGAMVSGMNAALQKAIERTTAELDPEFVPAVRLPFGEGAPEAGETTGAEQQQLVEEIAEFVRNHNLAEALQARLRGLFEPAASGEQEIAPPPAAEAGAVAEAKPTTKAESASQPKPRRSSTRRRKATDEPAPPAPEENGPDNGEGG